MGAHGFTLPPQQPRWASAEKSAYELCRRVEDEDKRGALWGATREEVDQGAGLLFAFAQEALRWMQENRYSDRRVLLQIRDLQELAFYAVASYSSRRDAKQVQLRSCIGEPLTVCVGERTPPERLPDLRDLLDPQGELEEYRIPTIDWTPGDGCFAIFADGTGLRRPSPPRKWCESCRKASSSRSDRRVSEIVRRWGPRECVVCGASFTPTRPNRWRCDHCLAGRRSVPRKRRTAQLSN